MTEIAAILRIPKWSIENHLHQLGLCLGSAYIKQKNLFFSNLISTCSSLLKCNKNVPFLKQTVIGDEKCILYNNVERKGSWVNWNEPPPTTPKAVCIQRMWGCIYGEIRRESSIISSLQKTRLLNSSKYPSQLDQLKAALNEKHLELVNRKFHNLPPGQHKTACIFEDQAKTVIAWLGRSDSSPTFTRHCTFGFPFISVFTKFSKWEKFQFSGRL